MAGCSKLVRIAVSRRPGSTCSCRGGSRTFERTADAFAAANAPPDALRDRVAARRSAPIWPRSSTSAVIGGRTRRLPTRRRWSATRCCERVLARGGFDRGDAHASASRAARRAVKPTGTASVGALAADLAEPELRALLATDHSGRASSPPSSPTVASHRFAPSSNAFSTTWGFRSSAELMLTTPTLQEQPEPVIELLQQYVGASGESPEECIARQAGERRAETQTCRPPARAAQAVADPADAAAAPLDAARSRLPRARASEAGAALHALPARGAGHRRRLVDERPAAGSRRHLHADVAGDRRSLQRPSDVRPRSGGAGGAAPAGARTQRAQMRRRIRFHLPPAGILAATARRTVDEPTPVRGRCGHERRGVTRRDSLRRAGIVARGGARRRSTRLTGCSAATSSSRARPIRDGRPSSAWSPASSSNAAACCRTARSSPANSACPASLASPTPPRASRTARGSRSTRIDGTCRIEAAP